MNMNDIANRSMVERAEDWSGCINKMPPIQFPSEWKVKMIPPYAGAMVRFLVSLNGIDWISVYMDAHDNLGCVGEPYWEIYPNPQGDCDRFLLNEVEELLDGINTALVGFYED